MCLLLWCLQASGLTVPPEAAWTIFAPNNAAFSKGYLEKKTGLSVADLQKPENKDKLKQVPLWGRTCSSAVPPYN